MLRSLSVLLVLIVPSVALAQDPPPDDDADGEPFTTGLEGRERTRVRARERVELNVEDADLMDLIRLMTSITGRRYIVTGTPRQIRATIASSEPVTAAEAHRAFVAILRHNGMTVVQSGRYWTIRDTGEIQRADTAVHDDDDPPPTDERFVTWIHRVAHMPVDEAAALLEPLRSTEGLLSTHAPTSTLIVVDTGANIARLRRILRDVDVAGGDVHLWVEPLHHADAEQVAEQVRALFLEETPAPRRAPAADRQAATVAAPAEIAGELRRVLPEPRTNQLVIVGTEAGYRRVISYLRVIDRAEGEESTVHVHRLQHGDAEAVAATLSRLLGGSGAGASSAGGTTAASAPLGSRVAVEPHADLNAVVITASAADYRRVRQLIEELDAPPRQVFLEMVLMELSVDRGRQLEVNVLSGIAGLVDPSLMGFLSGGGIAADAADLLTGIALGLSGPTVYDPRLPGGSAPSFGVLVHALSRSTQANILSTPHVLVLDNREAVINVGENVPLQGSSVPGLPLLTGASADAQAAAAASALTSSGSGGRRDTGTIVHVTPHINDDGEIRLEIEAEDSRQGEVASGNLSAVALRQSIAETELVVRDGQTAVIGGLMRDSVETVRTGVPFLSEIPVLGALFGSSEERTVRRNLLFFVTPWVVRGPADMRAIFERRMRERREFLERHYLAEGEWEPPLDYTRTRGLLAEMLDRIAELDAEAMEATAPEPAEIHEPTRPPIDADVTADHGTY